MPTRAISKIGSIGHEILVWMQDIGLLIIAVSTVVAIGFEVQVMFENGRVELADLLLLFIYLEVLAMVSIYLESGKLPVRIPLYIAIVALARYLVLDMKGMDPWKIVGISASTLILGATVLIIRWGHIKLPYEEHRGGG